MTAPATHIAPAARSVPQPVIVLPDWSYSRMETLGTCLRKYYYEYFGGRQTAALAEPDKEVIQFLKTLSTAPVLVGHIVHHVIKTYFKKLQTGEDWDLARLQGFGYRMLRDAVNYSAELRDDIFKDYRFVPKPLHEIYYNEVAPVVLRNELRDKINLNLTHFMGSDHFAALRQAAVQPGSLIEQRAKFVLADVKVDGAIDILYQNDSQTVISDWKTGEKEVQDTSLQLLTYAWWAIEKNGTPAANIKIQKAYLAEDILEELEFSDLHLQRAKARIIQDAEILTELQKFGNNGIIDAFTPCRQEKVCAMCPFKKLCLKNDYGN